MKKSIEQCVYIGGEKAYTTGSELALLADWRRRGRLQALRGYLNSARQRVDWGSLDGRRIIDACCRHIAELEQEATPPQRRRPFIH